MPEIFICPVTDNRYHPICERCPLPVCKDDKGGREYYAQRNREIYRYWLETQGKPLAERPKLMAIAYQFGVNTRQQVWEIISREKNRLSKVNDCQPANPVLKVDKQYHSGGKDGH